MQLARMVVITLATTLWWIVPTAANEKEPNPMAKLNFLVGDWAGEGWVRNIEDSEEYLSVNKYYEVRYKLDENLLILENAARRVATERNQRNASAFSVISYQDSAYAVRTYRQKSVSDTKLTVSGKKLTWQVAITPKFKHRYTIQVEGKQWKESGEHSADSGKTWQEMYNVTYIRVD